MRDIALLSMLILLIAVSTSAAQSQPEKFPVAVVLSPELKGGPYLIERRLEHTPYEVIHLKHANSEMVLTQALWTLVAARERELIPSSHSRIRPSPESAAKLGQKRLPWVPKILADLKASEPVMIDGIEGVVQAIIIFLPNARRIERP